VTQARLGEIMILTQAGIPSPGPRPAAQPGRGRRQLEGARASAGPRPPGPAAAFWTPTATDSEDSWPAGGPHRASELPVFYPSRPPGRAAAEAAPC
jgi:hypothetical protein